MSTGIEKEMNKREKKMERWEVWRIHVYDGSDNRFGVGRSEDWEEKLAATFASEKEAQDYVREQSRSCTELPNYLISIDQTSTLY
jgi:hypothetical protein